MSKLKLKQTLQDEFDRLYEDFITNPAKRPRLKKRVKLCRQPASTQVEHKALICDSVCSSTSSMGHSESLLTRVNNNSDEELRTSGLKKECRLQQASADNLASHPGRLNDNEHSAFSDYPASSQLDKKLSSEEVINIKEATSNREKDELLQGDQAIESDAFLFHKPRTNRMRHKYVKKSLSLDEIWAVRAKTWLVPDKSVQSHQRPSVFLNRNLSRGCNKSASKVSRPQLPKQQVTKSIVAVSDIRMGSRLHSSGKQIWKQEATVSKHDDIFGTRTSGKRSTLDTNRDTRKDPKSNTDKVRVPKMTEQVDGNANLKSTEFENVDYHPGIQPLFNGQSGHCGGIWKSIVDEC
ncbi:uncharacterized protein LOC117289216 [Asterias rubens]|uniref:uncharacterized protein LOC117289216 n=1 Tax=Asterias rubens TaxID=7604 RepID=UPI001454FB85|nr:uncharacterized protein LOC117289216 [Asterias rubens]